MAHWKQRLRCRMPRARVRRAWMVWAIWGMLGTSLTMEGTTGVLGLHGLSVAGLLTAPFWLAFASWPCFFIWRWIRDRSLWAEETVQLIHDPTNDSPFGLAVIVGRDGLRVSAEEVRQIEGAPLALKDYPLHAPDPGIGLAFETYDAETLAHWGVRWLEDHPDENGPLTRLAQWTDTCRREDVALRS